MKHGYTCFTVPGMVFDVLYHLYDNEMYPVRYGHHITEQFSVSEEDALVLISKRKEGIITLTGLYRNDEFEVFTAEVDGKSLREDGKPYHLSWARITNCKKGPVHSVESINEENFVSAVDFTFAAEFKFIPFN